MLANYKIFFPVTLKLHLFEVGLYGCIHRAYSLVGIWLPNQLHRTSNPDEVLTFSGFYTQLLKLRS